MHASELNAAVAHGMAEGLEQTVSRIEAIEARGELDRYHLLHAAKADALRRLGRMAEAAPVYRTALPHVTNPAERRFLEWRLRECEAELTGRMS